VFLAEDAPTQMLEGEFARNISASRQIYLTFPADSIFTEDDVSNYFKYIAFFVVEVQVHTTLYLQLIICNSELTLYISFVAHLGLLQMLEFQTSREGCLDL